MKHDCEVSDHFPHFRGTYQVCVSCAKKERLIMRNKEFGVIDALSALFLVTYYAHQTQQEGKYNVFSPSFSFAIIICPL